MEKWCPDSILANRVGDGGHDFINMVLQVIPQQDPDRKTAVPRSILRGGVERLQKILFNYHRFREDVRPNIPTLSR